MQSSYHDRLAGYGRWTYRCAWILEICAASLGLATGIALGFQAFAQADQASFTSVDLALASAPFFMVAIAELTKIPIATLLFAAKWRWKPIVLIFLIGLAGITFETVFMGLERAVTLRQLRYEDIVKQSKQLQIDRAQIEAKLADARANTQSKRAQDNLAEIGRQSEDEHKKIVSQIAEVEHDLEGAHTPPPNVIKAKTALEVRVGDRDKLVKEREAEVAKAVGEFERQRDSFVDRIEKARQANDTASRKRIEDELAKLANPHKRLDPIFDAKINPIEAEITTLRADYDKALADVTSIDPVEKSRLESRREEIRTRLDEVDKDWATRRAQARKQLDDAQQQDQASGQVAVEDQKHKDDLSGQLSALETRRIEFARTDQVRRIAGRMYGVRPEDVTEDQAGFITIVWFGSLAGLAALAGPLTAIVALSLQKIAVPGDLRNVGLSRLIRRMLLSWRWRRTKAVRFEVKVPVDVPVEVVKEVHVEHLVKEILYVPLLTDNPEMVRRAMAETLPKHLADLIAATLPGETDGHSAQHATA